MSTPEADSDKQVLEGVLRDLSFAIKALQLYPASSPVVREAVGRAHGSLQALLVGGRLSLAVMPESLNVAGQLLDESRAARELAERLHQRGVSHIHIDSGISPPSMQRLAEILAMTPEALDASGGMTGMLDRERLPGLAVDLLHLDRLYEEAEEGAETAAEDEIWSSLLASFGEDAGLDNFNWASLARDPEKLDDFLDWVLSDDVEFEGLTRLSRVELVRVVCHQVGEAAADLGPDQLGRVMEVVGGFYERLDREVWIELLSQPMTIEPPADPLLFDLDGEGDEDAVRAAAAAVAGIDLGHWLARSLQPTQLQDLLSYSLATREDASPRVFQLFERVLEKRSDRDVLAQSIRDNVERQAARDGKPRSFDRLWPELDDVLRGEQPDPYVDRPYRLALDRLLLEDLPASLWPMQRIQPRLRELDPVYLLQRRCKVLLEVLDEETDDQDYRMVAAELEKSFPEFIMQGQYIATEEILQALARHLDPSTNRSVEQRQTARETLLRFCNQHTLREVVRNMAGKPRTQIDAATRIFQSLGAMAIPALLEALSQERSRSIRLHLVRMLAAMGDSALPQIRKHLQDQRWFFVRNLVWIIGEIGDPRFVRHLGLAADHSDVRVRRESVRALAKLAGPGAPRILEGALADPDLEVRMLAIRGLGHAGDTSAVDSLCGLLRAPNLSGQNTDIIKAAAIALGRLGDRAAIPRLRRIARRPWLFRNRRMPACEAARWAISAIRGEAAGDAPEERFDLRTDAPPHGGGDEDIQRTPADEAADNAAA